MNKRRYIPLDYYESLIIKAESRIESYRSVGLYFDQESNPAFFGSERGIEYRYPYSTTVGDDGYKDEDLGGSGPLNIMGYEDPKIITKMTGRFTVLFIAGNILTGKGTHPQDPFVDNLFVAMSKFFNCHIDILNCDKYLPLLVGNVLISPYNQWIYPGMGIYAGVDGTEMSIRKNDGFLRRFRRTDKNRIVTINTISSYVMSLYPPSLSAA